MRKFIYAVFILLLVACNHGQRPSLGCDQITVLRAQVGAVVSPQEFQQWVSMTYQLPLDDISIAPAAIEVVRRGMVTEVIWQRDSLQYGAQFGERELLRVWVWGTGTSGDQLVACLGEPERYFAYSSGVESGLQRSVDLFFPDLGVLAHGWDYVRPSVRPLPSLGGGFGFENLVFMKPKPVEQIVNDFWGADSALAADILQRIKPWPGEWAKIEFPPYPPK